MERDAHEAGETSDSWNSCVLFVKERVAQKIAEKRKTKVDRNTEMKATKRESLESVDTPKIAKKGLRRQLRLHVIVKEY